MGTISATTSIIFTATTFLTVGIFLTAIRNSHADGPAPKIVLFLVPFWLMFQAVLGIGGFYQIFGSVPPRIVLFGVIPSFLLIIATLISARERFVLRLPLTMLTILHVIRIPVEYVLHRLADEGAVPYAMTYLGHNFDILSGISAVFVYFMAFRGGLVNRSLLIAWNLIALLLLVVIVTTAILAFPSPMQMIAFDQPNVGITQFPFIWLPTVVVPIVLFSHLASLSQLLANNDS
jgi:hypothetical protein